MVFFGYSTIKGHLNINHFSASPNLQSEPNGFTLVAGRILQMGTAVYIGFVWIELIFAETEN